MIEQEIKAGLEEEARLAGYDGPDKVISRTEMEQKLQDAPRPTIRCFAKMEQLDEVVQGFWGGELYALSGPPKNGKTLFAQTLTVRFAEQGIKSLWVSFEVPIPQFLTQVPGGVEFYLPAMLVASNRNWLDERILEAKLKYNVRAVFIDHLHYLLDLEKGGRNMSIDIGATIRGLKRCAVRHNLIIFILCHTTKALNERGEPRELNAFDIRDSSFVPQEADSTFIIQRRMDSETSEYNNKATLKVCNHRRTGAMDKRIVLEKTGLLFDEQPIIPDSFEVPEKPTKKYFYMADPGKDGQDSLPY